MNNLILHIGTHKTGSTVIQYAIRKLQAKLENDGFVSVPEPDNAPELMLGTRLESRVVASFRSHLDEWKVRYRDRKVSHFLMSWEGFSGDPVNGYRNARVVAETLSQATRGWNTRIVVYIRRQDDFCESMYTQRIQEGNSYTFEDFIRRYDASSFNWASLLAAYSEFFDRTNIIVRRYHRQFLPTSDSLLKDFGAIVGCQLLTDATVATLNAGYSRDSLEIARLMNPYLNQDEKRILRSILQQIGAKQPFESYSFFRARDRAAVLKQYDASNASVAREYFGEDSGILFPPAPNEDEEQPPYRGLEVDRAVVLMLRALVLLRQEQEKARNLMGSLSPTAPATEEPSLVQRSIIIRTVAKTERACIAVISKIPFVKRVLKFCAIRLGLINRAGEPIGRRQ